MPAEALRRSRVRTYAQFSRAADSSSTCAGVAPFCGPKTRATPRSPHSTLNGLQATSSSTSCEAGVEARRVDPVQSVQLPSARGKFDTVRVQEPRAQRLEGTGAAVRGAGVAAADQDPSYAGVERGADQLADAVRGRGAGVAEGARDEGEARDGRHLHHRRPRQGRVVGAEEREVGADRLADRARGRQGDQTAPGGGGQRGGRALAAVDQGDEVHLGVGHDPADARRDRLGGGLGGAGGCAVTGSLGRVIERERAVGGRTCVYVE